MGLFMKILDKCRFKYAWVACKGFFLTFRKAVYDRYFINALIYRVIKTNMYGKNASDEISQKHFWFTKLQIFEIFCSNTQHNIPSVFNIFWQRKRLWHLTIWSNNFNQLIREATILIVASLRPAGSFLWILSLLCLMPIQLSLTNIV